MTKSVSGCLKKYCQKQEPYAITKSVFSTLKTHIIAANFIISFPKSTLFFPKDENNLHLCLILWIITILK
ncbi:MAG: hypothetical protein J6U05_00870 [Neisseriaceae bacterium]|nr:hypothetical protein [Neisseriaceae bacterium]